MTALKNYRQLCAAAPDLPLFLQPWYLDAVCLDGAWDVVVVEKGGRPVAALPYFLKRKGPWRYVAMPQLTKMMGPYLLPEYRNARHETGLLDELLDQLPPLAAFEQDFNYTNTNWLPFYWRGFRQTTRYSYTLDVRDLEKTRAGLAADYRNNKMPRAAEKVQVQTGDALPEFHRIHNRSFERQKMKAPVSWAFLSRLDEALAAQGAREIFFAVDRQNDAIHSVAYLAWDRTAAYYLLAGDDPDLRSSGAGIFLAWEAIRYTSEVLKLPVFDFAGSMIKPIERVRRQFGAQQKPYFRIQKEWSPLWKWGKWLLR